MGQTCLKSCLGCGENCRKVCRNNKWSSADPPPKESASRKRSMTRLVNCLIQHKLSRITDALPDDHTQTLQELYGTPPPEGEMLLKDTFHLYDELKNNTLTHLEAKLFFEDYFSISIKPTVTLYTKLIIRERVLKRLQRRNQSPRSFREKAESIAHRIIDPELKKAKSKFHNYGYQVRCQWLNFSDSAGDGRLHYEEVEEVILGKKAYDFNLLMMKLVGMNECFAKLQTALDEEIFRERDTKAINYTDSPSLMCEDVSFDVNSSTIRTTQDDSPQTDRNNNSTRKRPSVP